ncbi:MAG: 5-dehydro-4-deoxy-D-glucuronate isomerase [Thermodesulfobacteriota bacterium]
METRDPIHPEHAKGLTTDQLRNKFLIQGLFSEGAFNLVYSHFDRIIVGGVCPRDPVGVEVSEKVIGASHLLERREMGVINIGAKGKVSVDGTECDLDKRDGLYVGRGAKEVLFSSTDKDKLSRFYLVCAPAHKSYPTEKITFSGTEPLQLGSLEKSNKRIIYKYIHPDGVKSCQLVMGMTILEPGNVWNTMPTHTHVRRMEVYFYFDLPKGEVVFHLMGEPMETRHIIVRNEEAVIGPSWSIHSGVGTQNYSFIWGMGGENQSFDDMDAVPMDALR